MLYRGINKFGADKILAGGIQKGRVIEDPAFMSTSRSPGVAKQFQTAAKDNLLIRIRAKAGTTALDVAETSKFGGSEQEILFPRGTRLRVTKVSKKDKIIEVELVPSTASVRNSFYLANFIGFFMKKSTSADEKKIPSRFVETGRGLKVDTSKGEGPAISWWLDDDSDDDDKAATDA